jgi:hypothetical protein
MIERRQRRPHVRIARRDRVVRHAVREHFDGDFASQLRIACAMHPPCRRLEERDDFIDADTRTGDRVMAG